VATLAALRAGMKNADFALKENLFPAEKGMEPLLRPS
jgi:hypothetical protein